MSQSSMNEDQNRASGEEVNEDPREARPEAADTPQWQPLFKRDDRRASGSDETEARRRKAAGPSMLTKVANLLDDVTEGSRTGRPVAASALPNGDTDGLPQTTPPSDIDMTEKPVGDRSDTAAQPKTQPVASVEAMPDGATPDSLAVDDLAVDGAASERVGTDSEIMDSERAAADGLGTLNGQHPVNHRTGEEYLSSGDSSNGIAIKGRGDGIAIEIGRGDWSLLVAQLNTRLEQAANFFRGGSVTIALGDHHLTETQLEALRTQLVKYGLTLGGLRTTSERTFEAAVTLGLPAAFDGHGIENRLEAATADSNRGSQSYFIFRGNLRSGQILHKTENVIVVGDINPGAQVISAGDVIVWGRLRGIAHAGAQGQADAIISALLMEPTQLRIASYIGISNDVQQGPREQKPTAGPETAYIVDGTLIVRPWNEARRGFRSVMLP